MSVLENRNGRSCSTSLPNYDQTCSVSLPNYDQSCSISLPNYDQSCSISLPNYDQGVQHFQFEGFFLLTGGPNLKTELEEKFVFMSSFIPQKIVFEWSSPLRVLGDLIPPSIFTFIHAFFFVRILFIRIMRLKSWNI